MEKRLKINPKLPIGEYLRDWLEQFQVCIRKRAYEMASTLFHEKVAGFGLQKNRFTGLEELREKEWKETWKNQLQFEFNVNEAKIVPSPGLFIISVEWQHLPIIAGTGMKMGRATIALAQFEGGKLLCVHLHLSKDI